MPFKAALRVVSAFLALLLISSLAVVLGPSSAAFAALGDIGGLTLSKLVNTQPSITGVQPGQTFTYDIVVGCDDNHCIDAKLVDALPTEFAGFALGTVSVSPGDPSIFSMQLTGGCTESAPITSGCGIEVKFLQPLGVLAGVQQLGIIAGTTFRISYNLTAPLTLTPNWTYNGVAAPNTANLTAKNALARQSTASVTVNIPVVVDAGVTKSWTPSSQQYGPGSSSTISTSISNKSNVAANTLILQDPSVVTDPAMALPDSNPFTRVDFSALCGVTLPQGANLVQVDAYYEDPVNNWHWVNGSPAASATMPGAAPDSSKVGGLRVTYTSSAGDTIVANGSVGALCFTVTQRATNRSTGVALVTGGVIANLAAGTVRVTGQAPATRTATASLNVTGLTVAVTAGKQISPHQVPASGKFSVSVTGKNTSNGTLSSLTITEPGTGSFLSDKLIFKNFTGHTWPTGATAATLTWQVNTGTAPASVGLTAALPLPTTPVLASGQYITGFVVTYTGAIIAGTTGGWAFDVTTDPSMVLAGHVSDRYTNVVGISGTNAAGSAASTATDYVDVFYPNIAITLNKKLTPKLTTPGGTAVLTLQTTTSAASQYVRPNKIVIEDVWDGTAASTFWDAYLAQQIVFTDVPAGSTLLVEYATGIPPAITWQPLTSSTSMIVSQAVPSNAVGLRFTYTDPNGYGQGTSVKPNIVFAASATLRSTGLPTDLSTDTSSTQYLNAATAQGSGMAGSLPVTSNLAKSSDVINMIIYGGSGSGTLLSSKHWVTAGGSWLTDVPALNSQSGATVGTRLGWGVTTPGYASAVISDDAGSGTLSAPGSETTPASTVFQAFNLTQIAPITNAVDPLMKWDVVSSVELYYGGIWHTVTAPGGSWMIPTGGSAGFKGYTLNTTTEAPFTTGVKITVIENTTARTLNQSNPATADPTAPALGSGVASSAAERQMRLQWQLRNTLRVPIVTPAMKWVTADVTYNAGLSTVQNTFGLTATPQNGTAVTRTASDNISIVNTLPNVKSTKTASVPWVTVPYFGDVALTNYPTVKFTVDAWNTAAARASYLRSADPIPCNVPTSCLTTATNHSPDIYSTKTYDPTTNPFESFNLTSVTFVTPANTNIDPNTSNVALWKRDASGVLTVDTTYTIATVTALTATDLATVIGVSVVYQSTDPDTTGGLIPSQFDVDTHPSMILNTQLRATLRSDTNVHVTSGSTVSNTTLAQSIDPVLTPTGAASTPNFSATAGVQLRSGELAVTASKTITPATIIETNANAPITVTLGATDGTSTLGAQTATIQDVDSGFWSAFRLTTIGAVTLPAGSTQVRVDVQLNGVPTWVPGVAAAAPALPATVTDLSKITGLQFVYSRGDGKPFSATVPAADWSASAVFTAVLRAGATFPGAVNNQVQTLATHDNYPVQQSAASAGVILSSGTARMDVRKEALTGNTTHIAEPGVAIPWTLQFTNTGTGYLDITKVTDGYDAHLQWDGSAPTYVTSTGGTLPTSGIVVTQPALGQLAFTWPGAARMQPGEKFVITLKMSLLPGLTSLQKATNTFTANTVQTLTDCTNISGNGQGKLTGLTAQQCGTSNYVQPLSGALLFAQKSVKGEVDGNLVDGAVNQNDPSLPCVADGQGFFQAQCVARTVVGATDTWRLVATNSGTIGYSSVTLVDVLPNLNDRLLATGALRGSDFRPVLKSVTAPGTASVPAGATTTWEVSTDPMACVGSGPGSDWGTNPTCSTATWVAGTSYSGNSEAITAVRWTVNFARAAGGILAPGDTVELRFDTVNRPLVTPQAISVKVPIGKQIAWNQFGVVAVPTTGAEIRRAPVQAGVMAEPVALDVAKVVDGAAASFAPSTFQVTLACTVRDGTVTDGVAASAAVDMGVARTLSVPANGSSQVTGIPLGATCQVDGEPVTGGATRSDLGTAVVLNNPGTPGSITVTNTFDGGPLNIIKNRVGVAALTYGGGPFTVQVVCGWAPDGVATPIALADGGTLFLNSANGYREQLPVMPAGTECTVKETDAGKATATTMDPENGKIRIVQPGVLIPASTVTITNVFDGSLLAFTGIDGVLIWVIFGLAFALFLAGILAMAIARSRRG